MVIILVGLLIVMVAGLILAFSKTRISQTAAELLISAIIIIFFGVILIVSTGV